MPALPPIPPIADADRVLIFTVVSSTANFSVSFPVWGDGSDLTVSINGVIQLSGWIFASQSGSPLNTLPQPITDGQVQFTLPVASGKVVVTGAKHPRQTAIPTTPAITRYEFQSIIGDVYATLRELYTGLRGVYTAFGSPQVGTGTILMSQLRQGLAQTDIPTATPPVVAGNIPANPYDPVAIGWNGSIVRSGDALYTFVQTQLFGGNAALMAAFFDFCATFPATP